jgi:hypothetical protein
MKLHQSPTLTHSILDIALVVIMVNKFKFDFCSVAMKKGKLCGKQKLVACAAKKLELFGTFWNFFERACFSFRLKDNIRKG